MRDVRGRTEPCSLRFLGRRRGGPSQRAFRGAGTGRGAFRSEVGRAVTARPIRHLASGACRDDATRAVAAVRRALFRLHRRVLRGLIRRHSRPAGEEVAHPPTIVGPRGRPAIEQHVSPALTVVTRPEYDSVVPHRRLVARQDVPEGDVETGSGSGERDCGDLRVSDDVELRVVSDRLGIVRQDSRVGRARNVLFHALFVHGLVDLRGAEHQRPEHS